MADLLQEVDDMMRQERLSKFWAENRLYIIGFVVGTIVLTGLISGYRNWDNSVKEKQTAQLIALQEAAEYPENILKAEKLDFRGGIRAVALLQAAGTFLNQDKPEQALELYKRAAADDGLPENFQELGALMAVRLQIDNAETQADALLETLAPVLNNEKSPWNAHAKIEAAVIKAHKQNDYTEAVELLNAVQDTKNLPDSLYDRASALSLLYTQKAPEAVKSESSTKSELQNTKTTQNAG